MKISVYCNVKNCAKNDGGICRNGWLVGVKSIMSIENGMGMPKCTDFEETESEVDNG